ncbi:hypothetical protein BDR03DRAFT_985072 [Suillus americanus]|nr:hypothetical protein BDR03DRAFT_985072 [Suillus americanus]
MTLRSKVMSDVNTYVNFQSEIDSDVSAPTRCSIIKVFLKKVTIDPINFSYAFIDGKQTKQTAWVLPDTQFTLGRGLELWRGYFNIQVGLKDCDEVIPVEMYIIALDQGYLPPEFLLFMVEFSSRIACHSSALEPTTRSQPTNTLHQVFGIQVGSKDCNEVIPAEMCIIAPDQGLPATHQHWNRQLDHSRPMLCARLLKFTVLARRWDHCNSQANLSHQFIVLGDP